MLIANVGEDGNVVIYKGPHEIGEDDLAGSRNPAGPGEEFVVSVGAEKTPDIPAGLMEPILRTMTLKSYSAEWHTAIDDLAALEVEWAKFGGLGYDEKMRPVLARKPLDQAANNYAALLLL